MIHQIIHQEKSFKKFAVRSTERPEKSARSEQLATRSQTQPTHHTVSWNTLDIIVAVAGR